MSLVGFALRNIIASSFRSIVIVLCVLVVTGFALSTTLITRGAEESLRLAVERLGADIVVVPKGTETRVETALLMGRPVTVWMPQANLSRVASVAGVAGASPQLYLASLKDAACCAVAEMFLVVFDPTTDFTIQPWLEQRLGRTLALGEVVGGSLVFVPQGDDFIKLYGYFLTLKANLEPTGTGIDQTMFMPLQTAQDMARISRSRAERPLDIPADSISTVMVRVQPGAGAQAVAQRIVREVPGVAAVESPDLFRTFQKQINALVRATTTLLGITWVLSLVLLALVFSLAANERRREMGVLRALGSSRIAVFQSLVLEALSLALVGGIAGVGFAAASTYLFKDLIAGSLGVHFLLPSALELLVMLVLCLGLALVTVGVAAFVPAVRLGRQDAAVAMRD